MLEEDRGVALVTVLFFMMLAFVLVSAMLVSATHEIVIAGLHRDGIRADEHAQAGLEDAMRRMEGGRPRNPSAIDPSDACALDGGAPGFKTPLPDSTICTSVVTRLPGPSGSFLEVRSDARVGRVRRRLSALVLARTASLLPGVLLGRRLVVDENMEVGSGDIYAQTFVTFQNEASAQRTTYAGWRIRQAAPAPEIGPCYTHAECLAAGRPQWWPGQRLTMYRDQVFRPDPAPGDPTRDLRTAAAVLDYACPAGPPPVQAVQRIGVDGPGFQPGDRRADLNPADPLQAATAGELLYGCTGDDLPYTWVRVAFDTEDTDSDPDQFLWFKVVAFDTWFARYWCFDQSPNELLWKPCNGFNPDPAQGDPSLGAIPAFPPPVVWGQNYDQIRSGGGIVGTSSGIDFGTCGDPPRCRNAANGPRVVLLARGNYTMACPGGCSPGHGLLLVEGDLEIQGDFTYHGTVIVAGTLSTTSGTATIHGSLLVGGTASGTGTIHIFAGSPVANTVAGPLEVTRMAWWER